MGRQQKANVTSRNIVLKIDTYNRLQSFIVELVKERSAPRISFDEAVNELLDRAKRR